MLWLHNKIELLGAFIDAHLFRVALALFTLSVLLMESGGVLDVLYSSWDMGNYLQSLYLWRMGYIPNIDFVYGYPGLSLWLRKVLYGFMGSSIEFSHLFALFFISLNSVTIFIIFRKIFSFEIGLLAGVFVYWACGLMYPLPNPGYAVNFFTSLAVLTFILGLEEEKIRVPYLYIAAFFFGLTVSFKQNGVFSILGFLFCVVLMLPRENISLRLRRLVYCFMVLLPFVGFILIRVLPNFPHVPLNAVVVLPWLAVCILIWKYMVNDKVIFPQLKLTEILMALCLLVLGASVWIFIYPVSLLDALAIIKEIYIRVPALIDRHYAPVFTSFDVELIGLFLFILFYLCMKRVINKSSYKNKRVLILVSILAFAPFIFILVFRNYERVLFLASPLTWDFYMVPSILAFLSVCYMYFYRLESIGYREMILIVIGLVTFSAVFPYPGNESYTSLGLVVCFISPIICIIRLRRQEYLSRKSVKFSLIFMSLLSLYLVDTKVDYYRGLPLIAYSNLGIEVRSVEPNEIFLRVADWMEAEISDDMTVGGYPNYGLILALTEAKGLYSNFIGNEDDFNNLLLQIKNNKGPDIFLVSPTNFPYKPDFQYFPDSKPLISLLKKNYVLRKTFTQGVGEVFIYRRGKL